MPANLAYHFASCEEGKSILTTEDDFILSLSNLEMSIRMKKDFYVSKDEFIAFLSKNILEWDSNDIEKIEYAVEEIQKLLFKHNILINEEIIFIKTTGYEEEHCGYTRQNAIILPVYKINTYTKENLIPFISHEIFHILSRKNKIFRSNMYDIIGFSLINNLELPPKIQNIKITNPDAPLINCCTKARTDGERTFIAPVLTFNKDKYNSKEKNSYFKSIEEKLIIIENTNGVWRFKNKNDSPLLYIRSKIEFLYNELLENTTGLLHPEEILAKCFACMITEKSNINNHDIIERMKYIAL